MAIASLLPLTLALLAATDATRATTSDQDQPALLWHVIMVCTGRCSVSMYFEIFLK
jgi:hypothetical protein